MAQLAPLNHRSEDVRVEAVIIAELELGDIERHVFAADLVERADDTALEDRPETFNRIGVNCADDVLMCGVVDSFVWIAGQRPIDVAFVGCEQADFVRHDLPHEGLSVNAIHALQNASNDVALALDGSDDRSFCGRRVLAASAPLVGVFVLVLATNKCFIDLDNAAKLIHVTFDQRRSDPVAHIPSGFVRSEAHGPHDLEGAHSLLAGEHHVSDAIPVPERFIRVLEYGSGDMGEAVGDTLAAIHALPFEGHRLERIDVGAAATRAMDALRPPAGDQIGLAGLFVGKYGLELGDGQLMNGLGAFRAGHGGSPVYGGQYGM